MDRVEVRYIGQRPGEGKQVETGRPEREDLLDIFRRDRADLVTTATARTLRLVAFWGEAGIGEACIAVAEQVEAGHLDDCCPVCEEVTCDESCPLAEVRKELMT